MGGLKWKSFFFLAILINLIQLLIAGGLVNERKALEEKLAHYRNTYLYKSGWTQGFGNYQLFSNNGGGHWYAVEDGKIVGDAEDIHPGLLDRRQAMDALVEHVQRNGPIDLNHLGLLEKAGFQVKLED